MGCDQLLVLFYSTCKSPCIFVWFSRTNSDFITYCNRINTPTMKMSEVRYPTIVEIKEEKLNKFCHRIVETYIQIIIINYCPTNKRKRERPKLKWKKEQRQS